MRFQRSNKKHACGELLSDDDDEDFGEIVE